MQLNTSKFHYVRSERGAHEAKHEIENAYR